MKPCSFHISASTEDLIVSSWLTMPFRHAVMTSLTYLSCMWSPISTTWLGLWLTRGMRVSGSEHMPASSMMHWIIFTLHFKFKRPEALQVHRITSCFFNSAACWIKVSGVKWSTSEVKVLKSKKSIVFRVLVIHCWVLKCRYSFVYLE